MKLSLLIWFLNLAQLALATALLSPGTNQVAQHSDLSFAALHDVADDGVRGESKPATLQKTFSKKFTQTTDPGEYECSFGKMKSLTAGNAPTIDDCQWLRGLAHQSFGFYTGSNWDMNRQVIINYGTCYFYLVRTDKKTGPVTIGNLDIESHIGEAIKKFGSDGHVGAIGDMFCWDTDQEEVPVEWSIFSSTTS